MKKTALLLSFTLLYPVIRAEIAGETILDNIPGNTTIDGILSAGGALTIESDPHFSEWANTNEFLTAESDPSTAVTNGVPYVRGVRVLKEGEGGPSAYVSGAAASGTTLTLTNVADGAESEVIFTGGHTDTEINALSATVATNVVSDLAYLNGTTYFRKFWKDNGRDVDDYVPPDDGITTDSTNDILVVSLMEPINFVYRRGIYQFFWTDGNTDFYSHNSSRMASEYSWNFIEQYLAQFPLELPWTHEKRCFVIGCEKEYDIYYGATGLLTAYVPSECKIYRQRLLPTHLSSYWDDGEFIMSSSSETTNTTVVVSRRYTTSDNPTNETTRILMTTYQDVVDATTKKLTITNGTDVVEYNGTSDVGMSVGSGDVSHDDFTAISELGEVYKLGDIKAKVNEILTALKGGNE